MLKNLFCYLKNLLAWKVSDFLICCSWQLENVVVKFWACLNDCIKIKFSEKKFPTDFQINLKFGQPYFQAHWNNIVKNQRLSMRGDFLNNKTNFSTFFSGRINRQINIKK